MGTPDFAVKTLDAIYKAGHEIVLVVTQPDKPKGRKAVLQAPPVKELALQHKIPVYQPVKIRTEENVQILRDLAPDFIVVAAFGQIIPKEILEMPPLPERTRVPAPGLERRGSDPVGHHERRQGNRRDGHADGSGTGHGRYHHAEDCSDRGG